ncbi:hypothetical protein Nepgr_006435 [Nepenthes gracilis]|uniref:Uncharacterized protein n=1 Tax=Nepenthes gracilis TaxID=150966 RepID=A0AAD3S5H4_NEPGR|nr:hypothetical protein Nepgr_006435 [Nepenthes gracilis]
MLFGGRYVVLLMALFSILCRILYNEFFSVAVHMSGGSAHRCRDSTCRVGKLESITLPKGLAFPVLMLSVH